MKKVVTVGSSLVDIFVKSSEFQLQTQESGVMLCQMYGDKIEVEGLSVLAGGGAGNTAVGLARLGFETQVVSEVGQDVWGRFVWEDFQKEGVGLDGLITEKREETGASIILLGPDGGRTVLVHRGAAAQLDSADLKTELMTQADWIHLTNLAGQTATIHRLFEVARNNSVEVSWNPGKGDLEAIKNGSLELTRVMGKILLLNQEEWQSVIDQQSELQACFEVVVVTNGRQGGVVMTTELSFDYQVSSAAAVDETGAGDAFAVGFVAAYLMNRSLEDCAEAGKRNAASVVQQLGARPGLLREI